MPLVAILPPLTLLTLPAGCPELITERRPDPLEPLEPRAATSPANAIAKHRDQKEAIFCVSLEA
jgi:hypothetical protein